MRAAPDAERKPNSDLSPDRFIFHAIPRTGSNSVTNAAGFAGLKWQRAFESFEETFEILLARSPGHNWFVSHFLFADFEPEAGDAYFSWIRDPVDMFYSGFRYWRTRELHRTEFRPEMVEFMGDLERFEDSRHYADTVLEEKPADVFPRGLFELNWEKFDFVGHTGDMRGSVDRFNAQYGTELEHRHDNGTTPVPCNYRRDELEAFLEPEFETYRSVLVRFDNRKPPA